MKFVCGNIICRSAFYVSSGIGGKMRAARKGPPASCCPPENKKAGT
jgi:hypothetical protein